ATPQPARAARDAALQFIGHIRAGGGTNIAAALGAALRAQNGGHEPHIVLFLTDGQSDSEAALRVAAGDRGDARIFTIGLGPGAPRTRGRAGFGRSRATTTRSRRWRSRARRRRSSATRSPSWGSPTTW